MGSSYANHVITALKDVLSLWRSGEIKRFTQSDIQCLERLIESDALHPLWLSIEKRGAGVPTEVATKMLLIKLFEAAKGIPIWEAKTATERKRILRQMDKAAERLATLLPDTPIELFSAEAIEKMGLEAPIFRHGEDFSLALEDLRKQVTDRLDDEPILRRKSGEDSHRAYFITHISRHLRRMFGFRSNAVVAELARIMLRDEQIDSETVRKTRSVDRLD